ncbi:uncharacterized protein DNG_10433 [Cephalotrichum gorgonifer]|uniref:RGS domain-containing protein n=1 Tax=Cephalotrichum gorgonifer TaxID=2041049 RepID=A0AAE8T0B1_9PEZI|nr:uncharacterized protein DNG_10433 [Cephalotrichum gorgonifer]
MASKYVQPVMSQSAAQPPPPGVAFDGVGVFYSVLSIVWTGVLISGMVFLYRRRDMPLLRIRSLPLSFGAVILLHLYWLAVQLGYVYGSLMAASIEYWIMSIYVPCGIGLFQASNSQFLHVSSAQKRFARQGSLASLRSAESGKSGKPAILARFQKLDYPRRMLVYVGIGMTLQLLLTTIMFLVSRKFHDSWGIPGTEVHGTPAERKSQQVKGWEWWPSIFWQMFWAWGFAPIILWKSRRIADTHGWRLQTMACCIAGLHASPMWLIALYVPQMAVVNQYFIPPQWIAISIMILEIFTILLPCVQAMRHQTLQRETLDSIARWEARNRSGVSSDSITDSWKSLAGDYHTKTQSIHSSSDSVLVMGALEYVLEKNPEPLRQFSALKDFSGENIAFLMSVAEWKCVPPSAQTPTGITPEMRREKFTRALRIYHDYITPRWAEFPINISSVERKKLEDVFDDAARLLFGADNAADPVCPFDLGDTSSSTELTATRPAEKGSSSPRVETYIDRILFWGDIPDEFGMTIFEEVEENIKYLVLTNTWPKFVRERRLSTDGDVRSSMKG